MCAGRKKDEHAHAASMTVMVDACATMFGTLSHLVEVGGRNRRRLTCYCTLSLPLNTIPQHSIALAQLFHGKLHAQEEEDVEVMIASLTEVCCWLFPQVVDYKHIRCLACSSPTVVKAYSAYHTACIRKHFLRHHQVCVINSMPSLAFHP